MLPNTGNNAAGKNASNNPFTNDPTIAPFLPPVAFPYIPEVLIQE